MIQFENTQVSGWEPAIRGMRNPMNSWEKSDSEFYHDDSERYDICGNCSPGMEDNGTIVIGDKDHDLMMRLAKAGSVDAKYRRMITVYVNITAPLYWWKEFDTYKVGTVANSCSTMHKIHEKEFTMDDFSYEHLLSLDRQHNSIEYDMEIKEYKAGKTPITILGNVPHCDVDKVAESPNAVLFSPKAALELTIYVLNNCRKFYLETRDKQYWWQMIQLLPSSYNQRRTIMLNYEVLANIYQTRRNHKLDEWRDFCKWIEGLPYSEIITKKMENAKNYCDL